MATKFVIPKSLAACADLLYSTREKRLAMDKEAAALQAQETALREHLINNLPKSNATGIAGKLVRASIENKVVYSVDAEHGGWDSIRAYIVKNQKKNPGVWGLMNKALNQGTAKEMAEAGVKVDGLKALNVPVVSLNKVGSK